MKGKEMYAAVRVGGEGYWAAPANATTALGATPAKGDFIARLSISVTVLANSSVQIKDGTNAAMSVLPANTPVGNYCVELGMRSTVGGWSLICDSGASAIAIGKFGE